MPWVSLAISAGPLPKNDITSLTPKAKLTLTLTKNYIARNTNMGVLKEIDVKIHYKNHDLPRSKENKTRIRESVKEQKEILRSPEWILHRVAAIWQINSF